MLSVRKSLYCWVSGEKGRAWLLDAWLQLPLQGLAADTVTKQSCTELAGCRASAIVERSAVRSVLLQHCREQLEGSSWILSADAAGTFRSHP